MKIEDFFREWTSTRPNLNTSFHDADVEAMAFAEAYYKSQQSEPNESKAIDAPQQSEPKSAEELNTVLISLNRTN
jgi:hypothetical protein